MSNDKSGSLSIASSGLIDNLSGKFENYTGMYVQAKSAPAITGSTIQ